MAYIWLLISLLLLIVSSFAEPIALSGSAIKDRITALTYRDPDKYQFKSSLSASLPAAENHEFQVLDVVLVASVDGKFHALNRTSGQVLWSMSSSSSSDPSMLAPLVRTSHVDFDPDEDPSHQEQYIIEPQSGDIYVMSSPSSPLQRLHFSMSQLVDMSPFSFANEERRVFVGKKETSLLLIELETGKIKATLNSECPWDPFEHTPFSDSADIDLDDLEEMSTQREVSVPTELFIGRTDYHISIYTRPSSSSSARSVVQNLSFSTYGPNNQDIAFQSLYRRTPDDVYVESLPDGKIMSLKTRGYDRSDRSKDLEPLWAHSFNNPVVAVFDVLKSPQRQHPFVLLQPQLDLQDVSPRDDLPPLKHRPNLDSAYVGLVEATGSLFAMTPDHYPLLGFSYDYQTVGIDPPDGELHLPPQVDEVTKVREIRTLRQMCKEGSRDRRCMTGVRPLELDSRSRWSKLLDGAPTVHPSPSPKNTQAVIDGNMSHDMIPATPFSPNTFAIFSWIDGYALLPGGVALLLVALWTLGRWLVTRRRGQGNNRVEPVPVLTKSDMMSSAVLEVHSDSASNNVEPLSSTMAPDLDYSPNTAELPVANPLTEWEVLPETAGSSVNYAGEGEDSDRDGGVTVKRRAPRRKRGKKKKGINQDAGTEDDNAEAEEKPKENIPNDHEDTVDEGLSLKINGQNAIGPLVSLVLPTTPPQATGSSLVVTDEILGFGSHGTVVFRGSLQGRAVAVKRLLQDFVTLASREVSILQESDDHPNVIRYYYQEAHSNFLYIALELCPASLADIIERPDQFRDISMTFDPKRALREITYGLRHLHSLKIVHRDIKPQNILVSSAKKTSGRIPGHRMLISDFGLCKKLDIDQTSFLPTAGGLMAVGTVGWRAPEILRGEVKLDESLTDDQSQSSRGSVGSSSGGTTPGKPTRLTKSVDIFSLGCLFYYVSTNGGHPFGDRFEREVNILKNVKSLDGLNSFGEEGAEAAHLIGMMLHPEASERPDTGTCLLHPFFWGAGRRLTFLQDASDRFEIMSREPRDPNLVELERDAIGVVGIDWPSRLDKTFVENLGKFRKYNKGSVQDLLRALRNKKHHYQDLPEHVRRNMGGMPEGFLLYFTRRFPQLFLHVHGIVATSPLRQESMFRSYFELAD